MHLSLARPRGHRDTRARGRVETGDWRGQRRRAGRGRGGLFVSPVVGHWKFEVLSAVLPCKFWSVARVAQLQQLAMDIDMPLDAMIKKQGSSKKKGSSKGDGKKQGSGKGDASGKWRGKPADTIKRPEGAIKKAGRGKGSGERGGGGRGGGQRGGGGGGGGGGGVGGGGGGRGSTPHAPRGRAAGGRGGGGGLRQPGDKTDFKKAPPGACLVGPESDIKKSAGYVCTMLRAGKPPPVMGI